MFSITKDFTFSASHQLGGLPEGHQCARIHGHNYVVQAALASEQLTGPGFVRDYGDLAAVQEWIDTYWDHRHLNDVMGAQPTAENLARHLYERFSKNFPELVAMRVSETPRTWAEYRPPRTHVRSTSGSTTLKGTTTTTTLISGTGSRAL